MPRSILLLAVGVGVLLIGLCVISAYAVLRAGARQRVAAWPPAWILGIGAAAVVPWLVVWLAPIRIVVNFEGLGPLLGWLLIALVAFALLVLLPLVALLCAATWWTARRHTSHGEP